MEASRASSCARDDECATITSPRHPDRELDLVVHSRDAASLDARAEAHLERCGATAHHEAIDAIRVVEPRCVSGRCAEEETTLHVDPL